MHFRPLIVAALLALAAPASGVAGPLTQDACPGQASGPTVWAEPGGVLENLLFAEGSLWVSAGDQVLRFSPDGVAGGGLSQQVTSAGGLVQDLGGLTDATRPGWIYVGSGNSLFNAIARTEAASVLRFDPSDPNGTVETFSDGFSMPNGMAQGPDGAIYISNDFDYGLNRIAPDGSWAEFAHVWGTNGLVISPDGSTMHAAVTFDQRSPIARISMADPTDLDHDIQLSFGVVSVEPAAYPTENDPSAPLLGVKGLDDMTRDDDGTLYVVANGTGELLRVDPATGDACLIAGGLQNPSSVRIAPEAFGDGDPATLDLFITEFSGAIKLVRYGP